MNFNFEYYKSFSKELENQWIKFENKIQITPFQSFIWLSHWQKTIGNNVDFIEPCIFVLKKLDEIIMIIPLGIKKNKGIKIIEWLGGHQTDYMCPLYDINNEFKISDIDYIWKKLIKLLPKYDVIHLTKQPNTIKNKINRFYKNFSYKFMMPALYTKLPKSWNEYIEINGRKKIISDSNRQIKRISKHGKLTFLVGDSEIEKNRIFNAMIEQKSRRYKETGSWDMFSNKENINFYKTLNNNLGIHGQIHYSALLVNDKIIATHWGILSKDIYYYLMPSHEAGNWAKYSPGRLLLQYLIEWTINNNLKIFDFTCNDEAYKKKWISDEIQLFETIHIKSIKGYVYFSLIVLKKLIKNIPYIGKIIYRILNIYRNK